MQAIVLAGGYATRLWPITKHRPKMLLPLGETTVIDLVLEGLERDDRIDEIYVSTNERFVDAFEDHLRTTTYEKVTVSVEETTEEADKFGVIGALAQLVDREGIDEDTIIIAGDNVISFDVSTFIDFFIETDGPVLAAYDVGSYDLARSYGLVELDGTRVVDFQEKPDDPASTLVSIACYGFTARTIGQLGRYLEEGNNPDEPGWYLQWLQEREPIHAFTFDGQWFDIGTPESYLEAVRWHLDSGNHVDPSARIEESEVRSNVHIMADVTLTGVDIENSVVFPGASLSNCTVKNSIVDSDVTFEGVDLNGALVGTGAHLEGDSVTASIPSDSRH